MPAWFLNSHALAARLRTHDVRLVIDDARRHGVAGLLAHTAGPDRHPQLNDLRRRLILEEELRVAELRRVVEAMGEAGVRAVILKGAALAYTHYPEPWCRTRADLDLLVSRDHRRAAGRALQEIGYREGDLVSGTWLMQQDLWERRLAPDAIQMVDVHVEFTNRAFFASRLRVDDALTRAVPAPFAGLHGWQLDAVDALLFSCVHRVAHHSRDPRLIWSCDIARQAAACTPQQIDDLLTRAAGCGLSAVCAHELTAARDMADESTGALASSVIESLERDGHRDAARAFLMPGRGPAGDLWLDLRALPGWRARATLVLEHLAPSRAFMLRQPGATPRNLPWRYVRRLVTGSFNWARR